MNALAVAALMQTYKILFYNKSKFEMKTIHTFFLIILITLVSGCMESSREAPTELSSKYGDTVVLYATSWCGYCEKTRNLLKENNIDYVELDIEESNEAKLEFDRLEGNGIPLVLIKGKVVEGYAPKTVLKLVNAK